MLKAVFDRIAPVLIICSLVASTLGVVLTTTGVSADYPNGDCDTNAVIRCGVNSIGELKDDYRANQGGDVQTIFRHFSLPNEAAFDGMVKGRVTKSGEVWVGNEKVATGAVTAGRHKMGADEVQVPGANAWMRPPSRSFRSDSLEALVKMQDGRFHSAVIMSCGNPVNAFPVEKPKPQPQPQPKPQPEKPNLSIEKKVRVLGDSAWLDQVTAADDDKVQFQITVKNTSNTDLTNLWVHDVLPSGLSFTDSALEGSSDVTNLRLAALVGEGVTISKLAKGGLVEVRFTATVNQNTVSPTSTNSANTNSTTNGNNGTVDTEDCEKVALRNVSHAKAKDVSQKEADAIVNVEVCQPEQPEQPKPQVKGEQTPPPTVLPVTGAAGVAGAFSITSILGAVLYKLKEFYSRFL